uniref:Fatty acyl-CoA delta-9 desaturase n=1 Tax=Triatoma infestans TaxID=30076 RepID=A0A161MRM9_TRIIF
MYFSFLLYIVHICPYVCLTEFTDCNLMDKSKTKQKSKK